MPVQGTRAAGHPKRVNKRQEEQQRLVDAARQMPGVADVLDTYGRLAEYTSLIVNVQPSQIRNATGANG